jgi:hypothetical protein
MYALSNNQLDPASTVLSTTVRCSFDISLQDIRNENQADYRAAQRMGQGNLHFRHS